jgi:hypothetical protein
MSEKLHKKRIAVLASFVAILLGAGYFMLGIRQGPDDKNASRGSSRRGRQHSIAPSPAAGGGAAASGRMKLSETRYWKYAYLISNDALDDQAKAALSGFTRKREMLPDGSVKITLKALSPRYRDQTYILKKNEKLYFIETAWGDDPQFQEYNLGDDRGVKVDANGYILQS